MAAIILVQTLDEDIAYATLVTLFRVSNEPLQEKKDRKERLIKHSKEDTTLHHERVRRASD